MLDTLAKKVGISHQQVIKLIISDSFSAEEIRDISSELRLSEEIRKFLN